MIKRIYNTPTYNSALQLSIQLFRTSRPEPINLSNKTYKFFEAKEHPLDTTKDALFQIDPNISRYVHPVSKIIAKTQGNNLSQEDSDYLDSIWSDKYKNYQNEQGQFPYQTVSDWKQIIINYWTQVQQLYPDTVQREDVRQKLINQNRVTVEEIMPSSVRQLTELEKLLEKWDVKDFNRLEQWELESDRFSGISTSLAEDIIAERTNGRFVDPADVANRVSGIGSVIQNDLEDQVNEGSLTFNEI